MQKNILITGASSGIGEAIAIKLTEEGHRVFLCARRLDRLQKLSNDLSTAGRTVLPFKLDVTSKADFQNIVSVINDKFGSIDVLINNAGVMPLSPLNALKIDEWDHMINVNIKGVLNGIAAVLPLMEKQEDGHIINVASIGAHMVVPTAAVYCATKYAVWAISDGLRQETDKLRVTTISPGVVESELANTITHVETKDTMAAFRQEALKPEAIATAVAYAIATPKNVDVSEMVIRPTASPY